MLLEVVERNPTFVTNQDQVEIKGMAFDIGTDWTRMISQWWDLDAGEESQDIEKAEDSHMATTGRARNATSP